MNPQQITAVLSRAAAVYSRDITADLVKGWLEACGDLPPSLLAAAVAEHIRASEYFPRPAEVRRIALRMRAEQAREADRQHLRRTGQHLDEQAVTRGDGYAMVSHVLARLKAAGSNPGAGKRLGPDAANKVATDAITEWREAHPASTTSHRPGRHCGRSSCRCTHGQGCEAGWITVEVDGREQVRACATCNDRRARILTIGDPREIALANLRTTADIAKREESR